MKLSLTTKSVVDACDRFLAEVDIQSTVNQVKRAWDKPKSILGYKS